MTLEQYLAANGREYPTADANGMISGEAFEAADLPMVVCCTHCTMSMVARRDLFVTENGLVYCDDCSEGQE